MSTLVGTHKGILLSPKTFGSMWHEMPIFERGIWIFFAVNTAALLTLLKFVFFGK